MKRIVLLGCSRSGTTIIQKELARHAGLFAPPETAFFLGGLEDTKTRIARLRWLQGSCERSAKEARGRARKAAEAVVYWRSRIGWRRLFGAILSIQRCTEEWATFLDECAMNGGFHGWVEKTPRHFYYMDAMRQLEEPPRFALVVRDGRDVVASIIDRARKYPRHFSDTIEDAIKTWNDSVRIAVKECTSEDVACFRYESFVTDTTTTIEWLERALMLNGQPSSDSHESLYPLKEWSRGVSGPVTRPERKWDVLFSDVERRRIEAALDWTAYEHVRFGI